MSIAKPFCVVALVGLATAAFAAAPLSTYLPPTCVPGVPFADITCTTGYDAWIEQFGRDGITAGCGGGNYCPGGTVTRDQMAVFIEKAMRGTGSWPPHVAYAWAVKDADGSPDPTASGDALLAALASIPTSGNDAPSADNPWLLKIGPGIFDLGASQPSLPAYVSMIGSGIDATTVRGATASSPLINCYGPGEVASLSVIEVGTSTQAGGLWLHGVMDVTHVRVEVSGASNINSAVVVSTGTYTLTDVDLTGTGGSYARGLEHQEGTTTIRGGTLTGSGGSAITAGITTFGGTVYVFDAILDAPSPAYNSSGSISIAGSQLGSGSSGAVTCAGVYDMSFGFYASTCP